LPMVGSPRHRVGRPEEATVNDTYDVVVIGGGAAGLSGAVALGRSRRSVLVIDEGRPRNTPAGHVHNHLTRDGTPPAQLYTAGRDEVARYGGEFRSARVEAVVRRDDHFLVTASDGDPVRARRLLVATGLVDELPDVPGLARRWGRDVLHCPYCHGFEVRDRRVGILSAGPLGVHQAQLWRQWTPNVLLLLHDGAPEPTAEEAEQLAARAVPVVPGPVTAIVVEDDRLRGVRLADGTVVELDALVVGARMRARADVLDQLGLKPVEVDLDGYVIGSHLPVDQSGATGVPGVWAAGNVADIRAQVVSSAAAGLTAAVAINLDLIAEDTAAAVTDFRDRLATLFERDAWEQRYRTRPAIWSGRPNAQLVAEVAALPAGRALDVGSGEGADAIWLAERGWQVTAVDISTTALERASPTASPGPGRTCANNPRTRSASTSSPRSTCICPRTCDVRCTRGWPRPSRPAARCSSSGTIRRTCGTAWDACTSPT
jgi:thioredoxin reductase